MRRDSFRKQHAEKLNSLQKTMTMTNIDMDIEATVEKQFEKDIEKQLQEEEDDELIKAIVKQNEKICCCISKKLKKEFKEHVKNQLIKSKDFERKIKE